MERQPLSFPKNLEVGGQIERCARLYYSSYGVIERHFGINALKEQIVAGSLVFLVPAIYLITRFLANGRLVSE
jgi:hypothetical protein